MTPYERTVAASVLCTPALASTVPPGALRGNCLRVVQAVAALGDASADPAILAAELYGLGVDNPDTVLEGLDNAPTVSNLSRHLAEIRRERALALAKLPIPGLDNPAADPVEIAEEHVSRASTIIETAGPADAPYRNQLYTPTWDNRPPVSDPLIHLSGAQILHPGNIGLLSAHAGVGKSSVVEAICAAHINPHCDALGFRVEARSLLLIDTERSDDQNHDGWTRLMRRCVVQPGDACPDTFNWVSLSKVERLQHRVQFLFDTLDSDACPALVILDGIGDLVADPNDSEECTTLIYRISSVCKQRQAGFFTTIHNNPSSQSDKMRGVLGSELWRKAQCSLMAAKDKSGDTRTISSEYSLGKNRSDRDTITVGYRWSDEQAMFVSCDPPSNNHGRVSKKRSDQDLVRKAIGNATLTKLQILDKIVALTGKTPKTAHRWLLEWTATGVIKQPDDGSDIWTFEDI